MLLVIAPFYGLFSVSDTKDGNNMQLQRWVQTQEPHADWLQPEMKARFMLYW